MKPVSMIAALAGLLLAGSAAGATVSAKDPASLVKILQSEGYQAKLTKDGDGDPMIESKSSGSTFWIYFYGCEDNRDCTNIAFHTSYNTDEKNAPALQSINDWNRDKRFASSYLDKENDPCLQMDLDLDVGGISDALFKENLGTWTNQMAEFEKHISW